MKFSKPILLLIIYFLSKSSLANTIIADLDVVTPLEIDEFYTVMNLDFGVPGQQLSNISVDMHFTENLWDAYETILFHIPIQGWPYPFIYINNGLIKSSGPSESQLSNSSLFTNMYIDEFGMAEIAIYVSCLGCDGLLVDELTFKADYSPVPLPPALFLFPVGLATLLIFNKHNKSFKRDLL